MPDMNDFDLDIGIDPIGTEKATDGDLSNLLSTVIAATGGIDENLGESGDPAPHPHEVTVSVPKKTEISAEVYNSAIEKLKRSFKEAVELFEDLSGCQPVDKPADEFSKMSILDTAIEVED